MIPHTAQALVISLDITSLPATVIVDATLSPPFFSHYLSFTGALFFLTYIGSYVVLAAPSSADEAFSPIWAIGIIQSYVLHLLSKLDRKIISTNHVNNQLFQMNFSPKSHHISFVQR